MVQQTVFILSLTSDIGKALAVRYAARGFRVIGTYMPNTRPPVLAGVTADSMLPCDVGSSKSVEYLLQSLRRRRVSWDIFISAVGRLSPATPFFATDFDRWVENITVNAIGQLRVLHGFYPFRRAGEVSYAVFFAGGGMSNAVVDLSAYTVSKIILAKMCELLDAENNDLCIFIVGPGWTKTKIHAALLASAEVSDNKYRETFARLETGSGTRMDDIFRCIEWMRRQGKDVASGRNISVVHDGWRGARGKTLAKALRSDKNLLTLRRFTGQVRNNA